MLFILPDLLMIFLDGNFPTEPLDMKKIYYILYISASIHSSYDEIFDSNVPIEPADVKIEQN
jgi:hypothetical protein